MQLTHGIDNAYGWKTELLTNVVAAFFTNFILGEEHPNPQFRAQVKAQVLAKRFKESFSVILACSMPLRMAKRITERLLGKRLLPLKIDIDKSELKSHSLIVWRASFHNDFCIFGGAYFSLTIQPNVADITKNRSLIYAQLLVEWHIDQLKQNSR